MERLVCPAKQKKLSVSIKDLLCQIRARQPRSPHKHRLSLISLSLRLPPLFPRSFVLLLRLIHYHVRRPLLRLLLLLLLLWLLLLLLWARNITGCVAEWGTVCSRGSCTDGWESHQQFRRDKKEVQLSRSDDAVVKLDVYTVLLLVLLLLKPTFPQSILWVSIYRFIFLGGSNFSGLIYAFWCWLKSVCSFLIWDQ